MSGMPIEPERPKRPQHPAQPFSGDYDLNTFEGSRQFHQDVEEYQRAMPRYFAAMDVYNHQMAEYDVQWRAYNEQLMAAIDPTFVSGPDAPEPSYGKWVPPGELGDMFAPPDPACRVDSPNDDFDGSYVDPTGLDVPESELPGMWERADFEGGRTDFEENQQALLDPGEEIFDDEYPDEPQVEALMMIMERLREWYTPHTYDLIDRTAPKVLQYGSHDLQDMGEQLLRLAPQLQGKIEPQEYAVLFYIKGKIARIFGALERGETPDIDSWFDVEVYAQMAQYIREKGSWG